MKGSNAMRADCPRSGCRDHWVLLLSGVCFVTMMKQFWSGRRTADWHGQPDVKSTDFGGSLAPL